MTEPPPENTASPADRLPDPHSATSKDGKAAAAFDPHEEALSCRDRWFLVYLLALAILPLIAAVGILVLLNRYDPAFDTLPKGPAPLQLPTDPPPRQPIRPGS